jgi:Antirestriction protein
MSKKVYEIAQEKIIDRMKKAEENGETFRWVKPWVGGASFPCSYTSLKDYRGINAIALEPGEYITYKQFLEEKKKNPDISIRKGCGSDAVFFFTFKEEQKVVDGKVENTNIPIFRYYRVFHIDNILGLESKFSYEKQEHTLTEDMEKADKTIEEYCDRCNVELNIVEGSGRAFYTPRTHSINIPDKIQFKSMYEYYSVCFHEIVHSTSKELGRELSSKKSYSIYSQEELVAEIGANMLCNRFKIMDDASEQNNIAYIQSWQKYITGDKESLIIKAANKAQKACDLICDEMYKALEKVNSEAVEVNKLEEKRSVRR